MPRVVLILGSPSHQAALGFGNFKDQFLRELHSEIISHDRQEKAGHIVVAPEGITVEDNDILEPEPIRKGGLQRTGAVCPFLVGFGYIIAHPPHQPATHVPCTRKVIRTSHS